MARTEQIAGAHRTGGARPDHRHRVDPLHALAAALSHEAWQSWYAEVGGEPVPFLLKALNAGGLAVRLARWALEG